MIEVTAIPILDDNYAWHLSCQLTGATAVVDPGEAAPIARRIDRDFGGKLDVILLTHHHGDHIGGVAGLVERYGSLVVGNLADVRRLPRLDRGLVAGDGIVLGAESLTLLDCTGHTRGHIGFYGRESRILFCGDSLFSLGCGQLVEGTAAEAWATLLRLRALPPETLVHCGHEYTAANGAFARFVDPAHRDLAVRLAEVSRLRAAGLATVPVSLASELRTNPFLRADDREFALRLIEPLARLGITLSPSDAAQPVVVFAALRRAKDGFKGVSA